MEPERDAPQSGGSGTAPSPGEIRIEKVLEIIADLAEELSREGKRRQVTLDTSLERELGFDSLERVELLMRLEQAFELNVPDQALAAAETPRDLLRFLSGAGEAGTRVRALAAEVEEQEAGEAAPERTGTLLEVLDWHVERHGDRTHIIFDPGEKPIETLTYAELDRRSRAVAGGLQHQRLEPGQAVALMLPTGLDYFAAFYGVQRAGALPVPLYPPVRASQIEDHLKRQAEILRTAQVRILISFPEVLPLARLLAAQIPTLTRVTTVAALEKSGASAGFPAVDEQAIAFLQFTSGSTGDPKGVVLNHANLLANIRAFGRAADLRPHDRVVSWLPLYHDMGLIGAWMGSLYYGLPLYLMSPLTFLSRPVRWLRAVHRHRGTAGAAPNFAYELCLKRIPDEELEGLDLSSWRLALNGAEAVSPETLRRFSARFGPYGFKPEALMPVYGLAECSLALAFPPLGRTPVVDAVRREPFQRSGRAEPAAEDEPSHLRFVSCGLPMPGHEIRIVDAAGREVSERQEGRIQFRGPSATSGYYRNPEATRRLFQDGWLETGDLGYLAAGEVYITGRVKDVIIRAGRNIYPAEVEEAVGGVAGVRKGCVAVFGALDREAGTERLVVMAETRETDPETLERLRDEIRVLTLDLTGTPPDDVVLAPPRTVLKTSSGKIRRAASREIYEQGRIGRRGRWVGWQVVRLAWAGLIPQLKRYGRSALDLLYAGYFWLLVGISTAPAVLGSSLLPGLSRRRRFARWIARWMTRLSGTRLQVEGLEHLAGPGPLVVAANHASYLDAFALVAALPPRLAYVAKGELLRNPVARLVLGRLGAVFVERFDREKGVEDTRRVEETLRAGQSLVVFPEGTFGRAPGLLPFRMGAFVVAAGTGSPVVPAAIRGTRSMLRGDEWFPRPGSVTITVSEPVRPEGSEWSAAVALRDTVRERILQHSGEPDLSG